MNFKVFEQGGPDARDLLRLALERIADKPSTRSTQVQRLAKWPQRHWEQLFEHLPDQFSELYRIWSREFKACRRESPKEIDLFSECLRAWPRAHLIREDWRATDLNQERATQMQNKVHNLLKKAGFALDTKELVIPALTLWMIRRSLQEG